MTLELDENLIAALNAIYLRKYAAILRPDVASFDRDVFMQVHASSVREDFMSGIRSGVNSTPILCINGIRCNYSLDERTLLAALTKMSK